ncbi:hypothetical protein SO802_033793 [Lithocarpus litseifolius]|uniref:Uncharacterized protein n=1 Tax=Lithocarpus litseifolius TaxID=425828 RepID=A0AAW2BFS1_9ROSI
MSAQTESSPDGMLVRSGTETSTGASSAALLLIDALWVISVLRILSLTVSLSLCFALGLLVCARKVYISRGALG